MLRNNYIHKTKVDSAYLRLKYVNRFYLNNKLHNIVDCDVDNRIKYFNDSTPFITYFVSLLRSYL